MQITSKGQVTIPVRIRETMGFLPHTEVDFRIEDGQVLLVRVEGQKQRGSDLVRRLSGRAGTGMTTEEIMALTRGEG